jgi:hypothetical protein
LESVFGINMAMIAILFTAATLWLLMAFRWTGLQWLIQITVWVFTKLRNRKRMVKDEGRA